MSRAARKPKTRDELEAMSVDQLNAEIKYLESRLSVVRTGPLAKTFAKEIASVRRVREAKFGKAKGVRSKSVFVVQHEHELSDGSNDAKLLGVYSSRSAAEEAVRRAAALPGFSNSKSGFSIDAYELDHDHWIEGFVTVD